MSPEIAESQSRLCASCARSGAAKAKASAPAVTSTAMGDAERNAAWGSPGGAQGNTAALLDWIPWAPKRLATTIRGITWTVTHSQC